MTVNQNIYKKAINHTAYYGAADVLRQLVGFIMLPIYTHYLTPEDYGVVQLFLVVISFVEVFLGMRMGQAIFRYYYLEKNIDDKKAVMSTAFIMTFFAALAAILILVFNAETASKLALGNAHYKELMQIYAIILVTQAMEDYGLIYVRIHQRPGLFLIVSIFKLLLQLALNVYLIVILKLGVAGVIYSAVISTSVMALLAASYTFYHSGIHFSKNLAKKMVLFSYPLWISALASLYIGSADKYILRVFSGLDDVGIYALAGKFGILILVVVWMPFGNAWQALRYEIYEMKDPNAVYKRIFIILMLALSVIGLGLSLFSDVVIRLMADKAFWSAGVAVPILVISNIIMALTYFNNFGIFLKEKTSVIATGTYINAVVITVSLLIFVKLYGVMGAAIASLISASFNLFWIESASKKLYDMQLPWRRAILMSMAWILCYSLSYLLPESLPIEIAGKAAIFLLFIVLVFVSPILDDDEKKHIFSYAKTIIKKSTSYLSR